MEVAWLEKSSADVPEENGWLHKREVDLLNSLHFVPRRSDWRLGRWTAKHAFAAFWNWPCSFPDLAKIEILPAPSGTPEVFVEDRKVPVTISLSHRMHRAICVLASGFVELGADLEAIEPHSDGFTADFFTREEQALLARKTAAERSLLLALLWSAKESALKALHAGLRLDTRSVIVDPGDVSSASNAWSPLWVEYAGGRNFHGWWQIAGTLVRTVVATPPPAPPIPLHIVTVASVSPRGDCGGIVDLESIPRKQGVARATSGV
jgi:phosphopantetheinyl transferase (holo-ACP synthase)